MVMVLMPRSPMRSKSETKEMIWIWIAASNELPIYMDQKFCGEKMMQWFVGLKQDSEWDDKRKEYNAKKPI